MKRLIGTAILASTFMLPNIACADWSISGGYANYDEFGLGVVYGSVAHKYEFEGYSILPEVRLGVGVGDSDLNSLAGFIGDDSKLEIDNFISASVRGQYNLSKAFGIFIQPSYSRLALTVSGSGESASDDDWEFNAGLGATYEFSRNVAIEALYESMFDDDVLSIGIRYTF